MATPLKELLERIPFFNSYLLLTYAKLLKLYGPLKNPFFTDQYVRLENQSKTSQE